MPSNSNVDSTVIRIRLPHLPMELYDTSILQRIGKKIGLLLKVDACTSAALRGKYGRICVQIPLDTPVEASISINHHSQPLLYQGDPSKPIGDRAPSRIGYGPKKEKVHLTTAVRGQPKVATGRRPNTPKSSGPQDKSQSGPKKPEPPTENLLFLKINTPNF